MTQMPELTVRNDNAASQYELLSGDTLVGLAQYQESPSAVAFIHTEIAPEFGGRGFGQVLVRGPRGRAPPRPRGPAVLHVRPPFHRRAPRLLGLGASR